MKNRYRLYRRRMGGVFYVHDSETGKQESLGTRDRREAATLLNARNEAVRQPQLNLQIAKAYLAGTDFRLRSYRLRRGQSTEVRQPAIPGDFVGVATRPR